jgi:hypothetical protein
MYSNSREFVGQIRTRTGTSTFISKSSTPPLSTSARKRYWRNTTKLRKRRNRYASLLVYLFLLFVTFFLHPVSTFRVTCFRSFRSFSLLSLLFAPFRFSLPFRSFFAPFSLLFRSFFAPFSLLFRFSHFLSHTMETVLKQFKTP